MKEKLIIGLTGEKGGGKETVGNLIIKKFPDKKVVRIRSSDILAETLNLWGLALNRHNLQHLAIIMDQGYGVGTLTEAIRKRIDTLETDIVLFDGIRWQTDVDLIRSFKNNFLIYITADTNIRFERIKQRKEKVGEGLISLEQFMEEEKVETEVMIPQLGKSADFTIHNNGGQIDLETRVDECLIDFGLIKE